MDARSLEEFTGLTVDHVKAWLDQSGWEFGRDEGGNKGIVSPCKQWSVACYWLKPEEIHVAVEHIADCMDRDLAGLILEMKKTAAAESAAPAVGAHQER